MLHYPEELVETLGAIKENMGGDIRVVIAEKEKYHTVRDALAEPARSHNIEIHLLSNYYPAGDEFEIVRSVMGVTIPPAEIPLSVGAVVSNVESIYNIGRALDGAPVVDKFVTVIGEVEYPGTFIVPIGTPADKVIALAGNITIENARIIEGGPMMGIEIDRNEPVKKTTSSFVVLPQEHSLFRKREMTVEFILRQAASACTQCRQCTDLCPRYLLGHPLEPHKIMRAAASPLSLPIDAMQNALICSECGVCDSFACPMGLSPRRVNRYLKERFATEGIRYPKESQNPDMRAERDYRKVNPEYLGARLGIATYQNQYAPLRENSVSPARVVLPLKQGLGAPSEPTVKAGTVVARGELVAKIPDGKLGANLHSPIDGVVVSVGEEIVIER